MKQLFLLSLVLFPLSSIAQIVNIPDINFKFSLLANPLINTNSDNEIQVSEALSFTGEIDCSMNSITDLTGIEAFTSLTKLKCGLNPQLATLDISQNTALISLTCQNTILSTLDVTQNINLKRLSFPGNPGINSIDLTQNSALTSLMFAQTSISSIDLSQNLLLDTLNLYWNGITTLDLTQNTQLTYLNSSYNPITSLDLSINTELKYLNCASSQLECLNISNGNNVNFEYFDASSNQNLTCIEVDDAAWSTTNWTNIDAQVSFSENCNNACTSSGIGLNELTVMDKKLILITDLMGREVTPQKNMVLIYVYSDGTIERIFEFE